MFQQQIKIICVKHFCVERILQVGKPIDELVAELVIIILIMGISAILHIS